MFGMSKKPKLVLFIGHHKVGSTSIQDYFARNAPVLAKAGILYPFVDFQGLSYLASGLAKPHPDEDHLPINIREPHNALAFRMMANMDDERKVPAYHQNLPSLRQMENALPQQITMFDPHTVVLAAEVFSNFSVRSPKMIGRLLKLFSDFDITLMLTLRRIDEYLVSWHGQRLKFGNKLPRLSSDGLNEYAPTIHFNYKLLLQGWLDAAPDANVIIRNYADVRAAGGSVADLIAQAELQLPKGMYKERWQNDSLHRGVYELARRGNNTLKRPFSGRFRSVLSDMTPDLDLPASHEIELFGADMRAQIMDAFHPIDIELGQISGKENAFFNDENSVLKVLPIDEKEVFESARDQCVRAWPKTEKASEQIAFLKSLEFQTAD